MKQIVLVGSIQDGYTVYGTFANRRVAELWVLRQEFPDTIDTIMLPLQEPLLSRGRRTRAA